jgi:hypothetical protein
MSRRDEAQRHARDMVDRARAGDQNAAAQIIVVRQKAQAGDPQYQIAAKLLYQYMMSHPERNAHMGAEEIYKLGILRAADQNDPFVVASTLHSLPDYKHPELVRAATVALSHQSPWNNSKVHSIERAFPDPDSQSIFRFGVANGPDGKKIKPLAARLHPAQIGSLCAGYCVGTERRIQLARLPKAPVSRVMGPDIGWELGE